MLSIRWAEGRVLESSSEKNTEIANIVFVLFTNDGHNFENDNRAREI